MGELKKYLTINSAFSALSGILMVLFKTQLNNFMGISDDSILPVIGIMLWSFAAYVFYVSKKHLNNKLLVNVISLLDGLWVLGSILIVALGLFNLSSYGYILIALVAIWIGFLGWKQYTNNK